MNHSQDLKLRIKKIAENYFLSKGYKSVKIDDIAHELGISKHTFYEIFDSKKDLFQEIIEGSLFSFRSRTNLIMSRMSDSDHSNFLKELKNLWAILIDHTSYFNIDVINDIKYNLPGHWIKCEKFDEERTEDFRKIYSSGIKRGYIKPNISLEVFYVMHFHALKYLLKPANMKELGLSIKNILSDFYEVLLTGVLTEKARKDFEKILTEKIN